MKMPYWGIKKEALSLFFIILRRERDSNPRTCYSQQFSRLPQSTTLPSLRGKCRKGKPILQKNGHFIHEFNSSNLLTTMYLYKKGHSESISCIESIFLEIQVSILYWDIVGDSYQLFSCFSSSNHGLCSWFSAGKITRRETSCYSSRWYFNTGNF